MRDKIIEKLKTAGPGRHMTGIIPGNAIEGILTELDAELRSAERVFPFWPDDVIHGVAIVAEEGGESLRAANQVHWDGLSPLELRKELVQTGAMCIREIHELDSTVLLGRAVERAVKPVVPGPGVAEVEDLHRTIEAHRNGHFKVVKDLNDKLEAMTADRDAFSKSRDIWQDRYNSAVEVRDSTQHKLEEALTTVQEDAAQMGAVIQKLHESEFGHVVRLGESLHREGQAILERLVSAERALKKSRETNEGLVREIDLLTKERNRYRQVAESKQV